jgi:hypothetical protein
MKMQGARDQLFAGAGFAGDQNVGLTLAVVAHEL